MTSAGNKERSIQELQSVYDDYKKEKSDLKFKPFAFANIQYDEIELLLIDYEQLKVEFKGFLISNTKQLPNQDKV